MAQCTTPDDLTGQRPYVLIGSEHSLYTGKLHAYLIWRGLPFVELTASAELYKQVILPRTGVAFIPVLVLPDHTTVLQDTHAIIQHLEQDFIQRHHAHAYHLLHPHQQPAPTTSPSNTNRSSQSSATPSSHNGGTVAASITTERTSMLQCSPPVQHAGYPMPGPLLPSSVQQAAASQLLELYGDEWLLLPAMHYRWSFPQQRQRLLYQFGSTNMPRGSYEQQMAAGGKVAGRFAGMLPGLGITSDTIPTIEARFKWQLAVLQEHFKHHAYLLASTQPSTADFGFIGPLSAHLYIDPVPSCMLQCQTPLVADYIERLSGMHCHARVVDRVLQHAGGTAATLLPAASGAGSGAAAAVTEASRSAGSCCETVLAGLQPLDPRHPVEGQLIPQVLLLQGGQLQGQQRPHQQQQQQQWQQLGSNSSSQAVAAGHHLQQGSTNSCRAHAGSVPATMLPLLHHMFLEQVPVIISTLKLLKAWIHQQQQQLSPRHASGTTSQTAAAAAASGGQLLGAATEPRTNSSNEPSSSSLQHNSSHTSKVTLGMMSSSNGGDGIWLVVPRFLGRHTFTLYDVSTGKAVASAAGPLQRAASSYVAWRTSEIVRWYLQLSGADRSAVQELLQDISAAGSSTPDHVKASNALAGSRAGAAPPPAAAAAAGKCIGVAGRVDAVQLFADMVELVQECGVISRMNNRVVVWQPGACTAAGKGAVGPTSKL